MSGIGEDATRDPETVSASARAEGALAPPSKTSRAGVPRIGRLLDLVGLVILLTGGAFIVRARIGYGEVQAYLPSPDDPPMAAVQFADVFWRMEKVGTWLIVLGVGVFVTAWWVARGRTKGRLPDQAA